MGMETAAHHYLRMARSHYREHVHGPIVRIKSTFYVLRALLAIRWIEQGLGAVPTEFQALVAGVVDSPQLKNEIEKLVESTRRGMEKDRASCRMIGPPWRIAAGTELDPGPKGCRPPLGEWCHSWYNAPP